MTGLMKPNSRRDERSFASCSGECVRALFTYGTNFESGTSCISVVVLPIFIYTPFLARSSRSITSSCGVFPWNSTEQFSFTIWYICIQQ